MSKIVVSKFVWEAKNWNLEQEQLWLFLHMVTRFTANNSSRTIHREQFIANNSPRTVHRKAIHRKKSRAIHRRASSPQTIHRKKGNSSQRQFIKGQVHRKQFTAGQFTAEVIHRKQFTAGQVHRKQSTAGQFIAEVIHRKAIHHKNKSPQKKK
jgi:hypothetical protein